MDHSSSVPKPPFGDRITAGQIAGLGFVLLVAAYLKLFGHAAAFLGVTNPSVVGWLLTIPSLVALPLLVAAAFRRRTTFSNALVAGLAFLVLMFVVVAFIIYS